MTTASRRAATGLSLAAATALLLTGCTAAQTERRLNAEHGDVLAECPWEADESVTGTVDVGFQLLPSGDLIVRDQQVLEACMPNADIRWTQYASGAEVVQGFGGDSLDIATVGSSPAVRAQSAPLDLPVEVVWIQDVIGEAEALIGAEGITELEDLRGGTVGVPFGSTAHFSLLALLEQEGLSDDVTVINLSPDAMLGAWQSQEVDAVYIWDPTLGELEADGGTRLVSSARAAEIGSPTFDLSVAGTGFTQENPEFMEQWTRAQDWAVQMLQDDPQRAAGILALQTGSDAETVRRQIDGTGYLRAHEQQEQFFSGPLADVLIDTADFLDQQGEIDAPAAPEHYREGVESSAVEEVAAG
ncbi:ABC transporter substrate-binding protein [Kocuria palustris]|uniref:taurine ABC transporter substrate-binding protein n=1 Tax=Kocuria palustris TaxID=71999 RepID=UPI00119CEB2B|nr:ABC transporter substrate-binding protein [Kocuria palustris]